MKLKLFLVTVLIVSVLVVGCAEENNNVEEVSPKTFSFGGPKNINMLPIIAEKQGYFVNNGLNMERKDILTGGQTKEAIIHGEIDFGVIVDTNIGFDLSQGDPEIEVLAIIQEKFDDAIVADASIQNPEEFAGKKIAITSKTTSHAFAMFYLIQNGVDTSNIEFVNMPPPAIQDALIKEDIEAGSLWQPYRYNVVNEKEDQVKTFNDKAVYTAYAFIAVKKGFARENPDAVKNFLRSLLDAEEYLNDNLKESQELLAQEIGIPFEVLSLAWDEYNVQISLTPSFIVTLESEARWAIANGLTNVTEVPNYLDYIYFDALDEVKPEAVGIIH